MNSEEYKNICKKTWFSLLGHGNFTLYKKKSILEKYIKILKEEENFDIYNFECGNWIDYKSFEVDYLIKIKFSENDPSSAFPEKNGNVFVFNNFSDYLSNYYNEAIRTLQLINELSRQYLLFGKKLVVLLNSDNELVNQQFVRENSPIKPIRWLPE